MPTGSRPAPIKPTGSRQAPAYGLQKRYTYAPRQATTSRSLRSRSVGCWRILHAYGLQKGLRSGCAVASGSLRSFGVLRRVPFVPRSLSAAFGRLAGGCSLRSQPPAALVAALPSRACGHRSPFVPPALSGAPLATRSRPAPAYGLPSGSR